MKHILPPRVKSSSLFKLNCGTNHHQRASITAFVQDEKPTFQQSFVPIMILKWRCELCFMVSFTDALLLVKAWCFSSSFLGIDWILQCVLCCVLFRIFGFLVFRGILMVAINFIVIMVWTLRFYGC